MSGITIEAVKGSVRKGQKRCNWCQNTYPADFNHFGTHPASKDRLQSRCRNCQRSTNLTRIASGKRVMDKERRKPCTDCGKTYPTFVMQFDHIGSDKVKDVSKLKAHKRELLLAEIAKCEVVCANCHAIRTHNRGYSNGMPRRFEMVAG